MRQKNLLYVLLILSLGWMVTACHHKNPEDDELNGRFKPTSKTLFVYMPWTANTRGTDNNNSLYTDFQGNINDMKKAIKTMGGLGDNRLIVFISQSYTKAHMFEISYYKGQVVCDTLFTYGGTKADASSALKTLPALGETTSVTSILNDAYSHSPSKIYATVVGCHGMGWLPKGSYPARSRAFGGSVAATQIDIVDYAAAIKNSRIGKMQFVAFDDCYLSNVETAYDMRHATDYIVASTSEIMSAGMPYELVLQYLLNTPNYNKVCQSFHQFYLTYSYGGQPYPYGTLSAIDCSQVEKMASLMKTINTQYPSGVSELAKVTILDGFTNHVFYDMESYVNQLCQDATLKRQFADLLKRLVPYTVCTPEIYSSYLNYNTGGAFAVSKSSGITISDPSLNSDAIESKKLTAWWKATH
uniref:Clostripain-related cysteine peptidase n=1 Tax=Prevotella sp. GTC17254 TaxID=3236794 RepID=A0AB33IUL6_9BACT